MTAFGFVPQLASDVRDDMEADVRTTFFRGLPLGDKTILGHLIATVAERVGNLYELGEQIYSAWDPDKSTGIYLEVVSLVTGTFKPQATQSAVTETLCGDDGTTVASGSRIATLSTGLAFLTQSPATIVVQPDWLPTTAYIVGNQVTNSARCYRCIEQGTSAGSGGPITTDSDITDGDVHWVYLGEGVGTVDIPASSELTGPIVAVSGDLTDIKSPASGWKSARNLLDAREGRIVASDQELRLLREAEIQGSGSSTVDAMKAALVRLAGVLNVSIFTNRTDTQDATGIPPGGLPPHSFEVLILGGDDQEVADTIANNQPVGIESFSYNGNSAFHTDSEGIIEEIFFSRPFPVDVYVDITVTYMVGYPLDGDAQIKREIAAAGLLYPTDLDVVVDAVGANAYKVPGIKRVVRTLVFNDVIGTPGAWVGATLYSSTAGSRDVVTNDGGRCYICLTAGTSAGSGGPTGEDADITDGTVHWRFLGADYVMSARDQAVFDTSRITVHSSSTLP